MLTSRQHHPVVVRLNDERFADFQFRLADRITAFAGSMKFVYLHALVFATWMIAVEQSPWPTLTLAVPGSAIRTSDPSLDARQHDLEREWNRDVKVPNGGVSPLAPTIRGSASP